MNRELMNQKYGNEQEFGDLFDAIIGGTSSYRWKDGILKAEYHSRSMAELTGYTEEEYAAIVEKNAFDNFYEPDRERIATAFRNAVKNGEMEFEGSHRFHHKDGRIIWIHVYAKIEDQNEDGYYIRAVFTRISDEAILYYNIANKATNGCYVISKVTHKLLYVNQQMAVMMQRVGEVNVLGRSCYEVLQHRQTPCDTCAASINEPKEMFIEQVGKTFQLTSDDIEWNGEPARVTFVNDITAQKVEEQKASDSRKNLNIAIEHARMVYWEYVYAEDKAYGNESTKRFFGIEGDLENYPESYLEYGFVSPEDTPAYRENIYKMKTGTEYLEFMARIRTLNQDYVWMKLRFTGTKDAQGRLYKAICTAEVITEYKELENRFQTILNQNSINTWVYDIPRHKLILNENEKDFEHYDKKEIDNNPELHFADGFCTSEDANVVRQMYADLDNGKKQTSGIVRYWSPEKNCYSWKRCTYTVVSDKDGKSVYAMGSAADISEQMKAKEQYQDAVEFRKRTQTENTLLSGHCSITDNRIMEMNDRTGYNLLERFGEERETFFRGLGTLIIDEKQRNEFYGMFLTESAKQMYSLGKTQYMYECTVCFDSKEKKHVWVRVQMSIVKVPETEKLEGFLVVTDITRERRHESVLHAVAGQDYDYVMVVDTKHDSYELFAVSDETSMITTPLIGKYSEMIRTYAKQYVLPEDQKIAVEEIEIANMTGKLKSEKIYTAQARMIDEYNRMTYKMVKCSYLDETQGLILVTRIDVTHIIEAEEQKKKELAEALQKAEQATKAKSDFLSRMSHDIRTPMNAIIGLTALTLDEPGLSDTVRDNLNKMRLSSEFLLGLVNDVLDMSKIEEKAVTLNFEPYHYTDFLTNIKTMFAPMCQQKGIHFEFEEVTTALTILTDKIRMNQIFFNIFSNAIKFTPEGGTVSYHTENLVYENGIGSADYIVSDTGIGMSEEFQKKMFEPFQQESNQVTSELQGTGLGLSIAKNLAELLGGTMHIESQIGVGTTVIIHLSFQIVPDEKEKTPEAEQAVKETVELSGKRVLLVEDHPLNAEIGRKLLEKVGIQVVLAENGKIGLEKIQLSEPHTFDAILMDIRMPVMDGLTAAKAIRSLEREDAQTIPIIAMTANAYEEDRREAADAGMNAHLAKPVNPQVLYNTLRELL